MWIWITRSKFSMWDVRCIGLRYLLSLDRTGGTRAGGYGTATRLPGWSVNLSLASSTLKQLLGWNIFHNLAFGIIKGCDTGFLRVTSCFSISRRRNGRSRGFAGAHPHVHVT